MNRKTKKEVRQLIKEAQIKGQPNKEIYNKLIEKYEDEDAIARLIVTTIKPKDSKKHRLYIGILLGFTVVVVLFNVWIIMKAPSPFFWYRDYYPYLHLSFSRIMGSLWSQIGQYILFYIIILYNSILNKTITPYIFWMCTCSYLVFYFLFLNIIAMWTVYWFYIPIDLLSIFFIIFLARFFQRKIFPDYRYKRLKRDEEGKYVFS